MTLLELDSGAGVRELLLHFFSFILAHAFLNRFRSAIDEVLGFFQAEAGQFSYNLDNIDLIGSDRSQHDIEGVLLLDHWSGCCAGSTWSGHHDRRGGCRRNPEFILERLDQFRGLEEAQFPNCVYQILNISHDFKNSSYYILTTLIFPSAL